MAIPAAWKIIEIIPGACGGIFCPSEIGNRLILKVRILIAHLMRRAFLNQS
jgi:hypothetical protein